MRSNVKIELKEFDIKNFNIHEDFFNSLTAKPLRTNVVTRYMAEQKECENDLVLTD